MLQRSSMPDPTTKPCYPTLVNPAHTPPPTNTPTKHPQHTQVIHLNEEETTSSSRIFIKVLCQVSSKA